MYDNVIKGDMRETIFNGNVNCVLYRVLRMELISRCECVHDVVVVLIVQE